MPQKKMANNHLSQAGTPRWPFVETMATTARIKMIGAEMRPITIVLRAFLGDGPIVPGGCITAAVASQIADGAAALLVASEDAVRRYNLKPRARIHHLSVRADDPVYMLTAPISATRHALSKVGLTLGRIDLIEINEAFASVVLAWQRELDADMSRVNVNGGAIALGHPLGATGARLMTSLLHELERRGGRYGLQTMCEGGGQANVTIIERLS